MIRINLLPNAKRSAGPSSGGDQAWIIGYLVAAALVCVVLAFLYMGKSRELNEQAAQNNALSQQIASLESESANIDEVREQLEQSRQLEEVVEELQRARYGPTSALMELSRILSVNGGPTVDPQRLEEIRRQNPLASFTTGWDPHRLWLFELTEQDRSCVMTGLGKTNEDVAEFLRRLTLSERFEDIVLVRTEEQVERETELAFIAFEINCRVIY